MRRPGEQATSNSEAGITLSTAAHTRRFRFELSHSRPSYRPSPDVAHVAWMNLRAGRGEHRAGRRTLAAPPHAPLALAQRVQAELVRNLGGVHGVGQVLLVGKHEQQRVAQLVLVEHALQLLARLRHTLPVVGVDDEDDALRVLEVCGAASCQR
jgi:hypothetical protein